MAENEDGAEKTHDPTDKRKEQAREEGRIVTSKEMFVFATLGAGTVLLMTLQSSLGTVSGIWSDYFNIKPGADLDSLTLTHLGNAWRQVLLLGLLVAVPVGATVLMIQAAMGGVHFAPKALGFKFDKLDPMKGLGRMVSKHALVELGKSILKVTLLGAVAVSLLMGMLPQIDQLWTADASSASGRILADMVKLMAGLTFVLGIIGAIDLFWSWYQLRESLMMTLKEVRDEAKEANGSPEVKGKIRQRQMEASRRGSRERAALADVPRATAIVTNPTHFAVAMRYVPGETVAPIVVASGKGRTAHEIMRLGNANGIRVVQIPILARALYFTTQIGQEIDERLFTAVAALLGHVYHLDRGFMMDVPDVDLPDELNFNEFGRPLKEK